MKKGAGFEVKLIDRLSAGEQDLRALHLARDGTCLAAGNDDTSLHIWDAAGSKKNAPTQSRGVVCGVHSDWINSVFLSADNSFLASGSDDNSIALYCCKSKQVVGRLRLVSGTKLHLYVLLMTLHAFLDPRGPIAQTSLSLKLKTNQIKELNKSNKYMNVLDK